MGTAHTPLAGEVRFAAQMIMVGAVCGLNFLRMKTKHAPDNLRPLSILHATAEPRERFAGLRRVLAVVMIVSAAVFIGMVMVYPL